LSRDAGNQAGANGKGGAARSRLFYWLPRVVKSERGGFEMNDGSIMKRTALALLAALIGLGTARADTLEEKAAMCAGCHGENGVPQEKTTPVIWGQYQGYLYLQLRDYKRGDRKDDQMTPVVDLLERDDLLALAKYFSEKQWPRLGQPAAPAEVVTRAQRANGSVGCTGCHQASYLGEGTQPRLAGQWREYMQQTMLDFRTHKRGNNPGMSDLMAATSEDDIKTMAEYLAGL
jgi:cytochrome c553